MFSTVISYQVKVTGPILVINRGTYLPAVGSEVNTGTDINRLSKDEA